MRELIVVTRPGTGLRVDDAEATADKGDAAPLTELLSAEGASMQPLFGSDRTSAPGADTGALERYYHVEAPDDRLDELAESLAALELVESAYVKPPAEPAAIAVAARQLNDMAPSERDAPPVTADYRARQGYLDPAPVGIDAGYAWSLAGGRGAGVKVIDCEWGWNFTHEDLTQNQGGIVVGAFAGAIDHGTAVQGEIGGDDNGLGVVGICSDALFSGAAFSLPTATVIKGAADHLGAGDILLLEIHRPGPNANGQGQFGYIAIEWWPDDKAAIDYATAKGIVVVEAAGNGHQNLDDAIYDVNPGFPATWRNPFNLANAGTQAVVVGAGNPPSGTHGRTQHPTWGEVYVDRARCVFSNHGARVDCQGWGWEVTTTGYGDLQGGATQDTWYTDQFSGTSSASPIVVGAIGSVQGILRAQGVPVLDSARARGLLRTTGSAQQDAPGRPATQRIGNRPDLRQLVPEALKAWYSNRLVEMTFVSSHAQNAWAFIQGLGWRRCQPGASDGVTNLFAQLLEAQTTGLPVTVQADPSNIYIVYA